jgi:hypothetical protein
LPAAAAGLALGEATEGAWADVAGAVLVVGAALAAGALPCEQPTNTASGAAASIISGSNFRFILVLMIDTCHRQCPPRVAVAVYSIARTVCPAAALHDPAAPDSGRSR